MLRYRCGEKPHQNQQLRVTGIPRGGNRTTLQPHTNINTLIGRPAPSPPRAAETPRTAGLGPRALSGMLLSQHRSQQQIIRLDGTQVSIATTQELPITGRQCHPAPGIEPLPPAVGAADDTIVLYRRYTAPGTQNIQLAPALPKQPRGSLHAQSNPLLRLPIKSRKNHYSVPVSVPWPRHTTPQNSTFLGCRSNCSYTSQAVRSVLTRSPPKSPWSLDIGSAGWKTDGTHRQTEPVLRDRNKPGCVPAHVGPSAGHPGHSWLSPAKNGQ